MPAVTTAAVPHRTDVAAHAAKHLQCSEVWGGFEQVDRALDMPGLDGRVYSQPFNSGTGGGDVHYVSSCASGVYSRILLADVSGHGSDVAKTAARLKRLMRRHIAHHSQGALVRKVNREFTAMTDDGVFATAVVMTYDSHRRRLLVSNAGHPPPLFHSAATGEWSYLQRQPSGLSVDEREAPEGLPLGIVPTAVYRESEYKLAPGDLVLSYTDWLIEAKQASTGELLGAERLLALARGLPAAGTVEQTVRRLLDAVIAWCESAPCDDDVTVLAFRAREGPIVRTSVGTWIMAPFRVTRTLVRSFVPVP
jgi:serine phosphatase RsbU (regulator of sigma subunit)